MTKAAPTISDARLLALARQRHSTSERAWRIFDAREAGETYETIATRWEVSKPRVRQIYLKLKARIARGELNARFVKLQE